MGWRGGQGCGRVVAAGRDQGGGLQIRFGLVVSHVAPLARFRHQDNKEPKDIAALLHRDRSTVTRHLRKYHTQKKQGRPPILTEKQLSVLEKKLESMVQKADGKYRVTVAMLKKSARCKEGTRAIWDALHKRGIYFRSMREKPILLDEDVAERMRFAEKFRHMPKSYWTTRIHMTIDVKLFRVYLNGVARERAAKMRVPGAYRKKGQGLGRPYVRPSRTLKYNTGAESARVLAGVGQGRVLVWEYLPGNKWNGQVAAQMYLGPVKRALSRAYPDRSYYNVLEDNDPSGFKSNKGSDAKAAAKIRPFDIPKRSPQLNMCDYALWTEVNVRMREEEQGWPRSKTETRDQYLARLRRTALGLPKKFIQESLQNMKTRCERLWKAEGGNFEEGS